MSDIFATLLEFFGISAIEGVSTFPELLSWFMSVLLSIGLFLFFFAMIKSVVYDFKRGLR